MTKNITENFNYEEFFASATAQKEGIYNFPSIVEFGFVFCNVTKLSFLLQRIRDILGVPIKITSGFRCGQLNVAVGGVENSRHLLGAAVDIRCSKMSELKTLIRKFEEKLVYSYEQSVFASDGTLKPKTYNRCIKLVDEPGWYHLQLQEPATRVSIEVFYNLVENVVC